MLFVNNTFAPGQGLRILPGSAPPRKSGPASAPLTNLRRSALPAGPSGLQANYLAKAATPSCCAIQPQMAVPVLCQGLGHSHVRLPGGIDTHPQHTRVSARSCAKSDRTGAPTSACVRHRRCLVVPGGTWLCRRPPSLAPSGSPANLAALAQFIHLGPDDRRAVRLVGVEPEVVLMVGLGRIEDL